MNNDKVNDGKGPYSDYEVWGVVARTQKLISHERSLELNRYGITPEQSHILHYLHDCGGTSTLNAIASFSLVNHNAVSMMVRRMEKAGLATRSKSTSNKHYLVSITEKGKMIFEAMPINSIKMTFSALTADEKIQLVRLLNKLGERAQELLGIDYTPPFLDEQE